MGEAAERDDVFELELDDILGIESEPEPELETEPEPGPETEVKDSENGETGDLHDDLEEVKRKLPEQEKVEPETTVTETETVVDDDPVKAQNKALLERLEKLETLLAEKSKEPVKKVPDKPEIPEVSFLTDDDDIDEVLSRDGLNALMKKVYAKALEDSRGMSNSAQINPDVVNQIQKQLLLTKGVDSYFENNPELLQVRKTVGVITDEVIREHQDWNLSQVLEEAGTRTRTLLGIKKTDSKKPGERNPALINKGSSRQKSADMRTDMQKEIDDIL